MIRTVPHEIQLEAIREQESLRWPEFVPAYAEIPRPGGKTVWQSYENLTIADCEQLVEHHSRKAIKAIERFEQTRSKISARTAGHHIIYARLYRCTYLSLMGIEDSTEDDLPFPCRENDQKNG